MCSFRFHYWINSPNGLLIRPTRNRSVQIFWSHQEGFKRLSLQQKQVRVCLLALAVARAEHSDPSVQSPLVICWIFSLLCIFKVTYLLSPFRKEGEKRWSSFGVISLSVISVCAGPETHCRSVFSTSKAKYVHRSLPLVLGLKFLCPSSQQEILDTKMWLFTVRFYIEVYLFKRYSNLSSWQRWDGDAAPLCPVLHKSSQAAHPLSATLLSRAQHMKF